MEREGIKAKKYPGEDTLLILNSFERSLNTRRNTMFHYIYGKNKKNHTTRTTFFYNNSFAKTRAIPNAEKYDETLGISSLRG